MKCNLDCDYCETGINGGHDNATRHPKLADCIQALEFMYAYVDRILQRRRLNFRVVILNVYGGEAVHHPNIVEILQAARNLHRHYADRWSLTITCTTNAVVNTEKWNVIAALVDEFTVSWHTNNTQRQKDLCRKNLLTLKQLDRAVKCVVLMHPEFFQDAQQQIQWCGQHQIRVLPRHLDHRPQQTQFNYTQNQTEWFEKLYGKKLIPILDQSGLADLASTGRVCCGGREFCVDGNYRNSQQWVKNHFKDWYCSVDQFFLYVKQVNGEVYVNKDCRMNYHNEVGAIGNLNDTAAILQEIGNTPVIQCKKNRCLCGLCAPKAVDLDTYTLTMKKYEISITDVLS